MNFFLFSFLLYFEFFIYCTHFFTFILFFYFKEKKIRHKLITFTLISHIFSSILVKKYFFVSFDSEILV